MTKIKTKVDLPDGAYKGFWTGYIIHIPFVGEDVYLETDDANGGINEPVEIAVVNKVPKIK